MKLIASIFALVALTAVSAQACPPQLLGQCYSQRIVQRQQFVQQVYAAPIVQRQVIQYEVQPVIQKQVYVQRQEVPVYVQQQVVEKQVIQKDKVRLRLRSPIVRQRVAVQRIKY